MLVLIAVKLRQLAFLKNSLGVLRLIAGSFFAVFGLHLQFFHSDLIAAGTQIQLVLFFDLLTLMIRSRYFFLTHLRAIVLLPLVFFQ